MKKQRKSRGLGMTFIICLSGFIRLWRRYTGGGARLCGGICAGGKNGTCETGQLYGEF